MSRLKQKYEKEIVSAFMTKHNITNKMAVPKLQKIVINMGVGKALENKKRLDNAVRDLGLIAGQKPIVTKAKQAIAGFKLREGNEIGCKVTLRGEKMYEFLDRLIYVVIPRIRDFRGLKTNSFDKHGNYSLGVTEQSMFPEINLDDMEFFQGMDITMTFQNSTKELSFDLLQFFGMPFKREEEKNN